MNGASMPPGAAGGPGGKSGEEPHTWPRAITPSAIYREIEKATTPKEARSIIARYTRELARREPALAKKYTRMLQRSLETTCKRRDEGTVILQSALEALTGEDGLKGKPRR